VVYWHYNPQQKFKKEPFMAVAVKLSDNIVSEAKIISKAFNRSVAGQLEYWAKIGKIAEENPDLTYELIKNMLVAKQEELAGRLEPYVFEKNRTKGSNR
jgi:hypothetical protein